ncbi:hypothetical protein HGRIS_005262 [Hohenbuehelia grisea]|uniref:Uncharacterized protein n=1 Tax=Hohenbuehelia grisea TaxID=104357 RepID=A0ABR3JFZ4_9AGAR
MRRGTMIMTRRARSPQDKQMQTETKLLVVIHPALEDKLSSLIVAAAPAVASPMVMALSARDIADFSARRRPFPYSDDNRKGGRDDDDGRRPRPRPDDDDEFSPTP